MKVFRSITYTTLYISLISVSAAAHRELLQLKTWHLAGANINQGDYDNRTALHVVSLSGDFADNGNLNKVR